MTDLPLIPVRVVSSWNPSSATVSRPRFATCDDDLDYCIKHDANDQPVRANEWICTWLARAVGIAVPTPAVVQDLDGKTLFGSQIAGDDTNDNLSIFSVGALEREQLNHIHKTFALDLFIKNMDRHVNNYKIFTQNRRDRILSFDFGDSLFSYWPDLSLPLPANSRTISNMRAIIGRYGHLNIDVANNVLTRLDQLEGSAMVNAIRSLPRGWLDKRTGTAFTGWFGGRARRERIQQIREGIRDGSYL